MLQGYDKILREAAFKKDQEAGHRAGTTQVVRWARLFQGTLRLCGAFLVASRRLQAPLGMFIQ